MDTVEEKSLFFLRSVLYSLVSQKKEISDKLIEMHVCFRWQPDFSAMEDCSFFFFFFFFKVSTSFPGYLLLLQRVETWR